ncbi:MAG: hypothetical protein HDS15_03660 [Bacteroides sp.]|nr:hypothetical protein [Bacteroides sp.]
MEFGSDFHYLLQYPDLVPFIKDIKSEYRLYAEGRHAFESILIKENIKRVWIPSYYCYESITGIESLGIQIVFYHCSPVSDLREIITSLCIKSKEAILVMNYFGLHSQVDYSEHDFLIIEDHSHDPISDWALHSNADWCFASLRKTIPVADGGILWSPVGRSLPLEPETSWQAVKNFDYRYSAMKEKTNYLLTGTEFLKNHYLTVFKDTEEAFSSIPICAISALSRQIVKSFDLRYWLDLKKRNFEILRSLLIPDSTYEILQPLTSNTTPFSLILLFTSQQKRDAVRRYLIQSQVYPAILWAVPENTDSESDNFSKRMLSIHCDGRYTPTDMEELACRINKAIKK